MKSHLTRLAIALLVTLLTNSCATIMTGTNQTVDVESSPPGANVRVEKLGTSGIQTIWEGTTPATLELGRKHSYLVILSKTGYEPMEVPVEGNKMNPWVWGNLLIGGLPGLLVDGFSGAILTLEPGDVSVTLLRKKSTSSTGPPPLERFREQVHVTWRNEVVEDVP